MAVTWPAELSKTVYFIFAWADLRVGGVGLGPPVGFFPLFTLEISQQKKKIFGEITMPNVFAEIELKKNVKLPNCLL